MGARDFIRSLVGWCGTQMQAMGWGRGLFVLRYFVCGVRFFVVGGLIIIYFLFFEREKL